MGIYVHMWNAENSTSILTRRHIHTHTTTYVSTVYIVDTKKYNNLSARCTMQIEGVKLFQLTDTPCMADTVSCDDLHIKKLLRHTRLLSFKVIHYRITIKFSLFHFFIISEKDKVFNKLILVDILESGVYILL